MCEFLGVGSTKFFFTVICIDVTAPTPKFPGKFLKQAAPTPGLLHLTVIQNRDKNFTFGRSRGRTTLRCTDLKRTSRHGLSD